MKSNAPFRVASTAVSIVPCPDIMMTGRSGFLAFTCSSSSMPSIPGIFTSQRTTPIAGSSSSAFSAAFASPASATSIDSYLRIIRTASRMGFSSSTIRTFATGSLFRLVSAMPLQ